MLPNQLLINNRKPIFLYNVIFILIKAKAIGNNRKLFDIKILPL